MKMRRSDREKFENGDWDRQQAVASLITAGVQAFKNGYKRSDLKKYLQEKNYSEADIDIVLRGYDEEEERFSR